MKVCSMFSQILPLIDRAILTGAVFHILSALGSAGRLGFTAVGDSPQNAEEIYARVIKVLDEEAKASVGLQDEPEVEVIETEGSDFAI